VSHDSGHNSISASLNMPFTLETFAPSCIAAITGFRDEVHVAPHREIAAD